MVGPIGSDSRKSAALLLNLSLLPIPNGLHLQIYSLPYSPLPRSPPIFGQIWNISFLIPKYVLPRDLLSPVISPNSTFPPPKVYSGKHSSAVFFYAKENSIACLIGYLASPDALEVIVVTELLTYLLSVSTDLTDVTLVSDDTY